MRRKPLDGLGEPVAEGVKYTAWQGFAQSALTVSPGAEAIAPDERISAAPQNWVPAETPRDRWPSVFDQLLAEHERIAGEVDAERAAKEERAKARGRVRAKERLFAAGGYVEAGEVFFADDALVRANPSSFEKVT